MAEDYQSHLQKKINEFNSAEEKISSAIEVVNAILKREERVKKEETGHFNRIDDMARKVKQQLEMLQNRGDGIAFVGKSGCGKSTLLNHLMTGMSIYDKEPSFYDKNEKYDPKNWRLLPTKAEHTGKDHLITTAIVTELVRVPPNEKNPNSHSITVTFIDADSWHMILRQLEADAPNPDSKKPHKFKQSTVDLLNNVYKMLTKCDDSCSKIFPWEKQEFPKETKDQLATIRDWKEGKGNDCIAKFLSSKANLTMNFTFSGPKWIKDMSLFMEQTATGDAAWAPLISHIKVVGPFGKECKLPMYVPIFDVPGSGDPIQSRNEQRKSALKRAQHAVILCSGSVGANCNCAGQGKVPINSFLPDVIETQECFSRLAVLCAGKNENTLRNTFGFVTHKEKQKAEALEERKNPEECLSKTTVHPLKEELEKGQLAIFDYVCIDGLIKESGDKWVKESKKTIKKAKKKKDIIEAEIQQNVAKCLLSFFENQCDKVYKYLNDVANGSLSYLDKVMHDFAQLLLFMDNPTALTLENSGDFGREHEKKNQLNQYCDDWKQSLLAAFEGVKFPEICKSEFERFYYDHCEDKYHHYRKRIWAAGYGRATLYQNTQNQLTFSTSNDIAASILQQVSRNRDVKKKIECFAALFDSIPKKDLETKRISGMFSNWTHELIEQVDEVMFGALKEVFTKNRHDPYTPVDDQEKYGHLFLNDAKNLINKKDFTQVKTEIRNRIHNYFETLHKMIEMVSFSKVDNLPETLKNTPNTPPQNHNLIVRGCQAISDLAFTRPGICVYVVKRVDTEPNILKLEVQPRTDPSCIKNQINDIENLEAVEHVVLRFINMTDDSLLKIAKILYEKCPKLLSVDVSFNVHVTSEGVTQLKRQLDMNQLKGKVSIIDRYILAGDFRCPPTPPSISRCVPPSSRRDPLPITPSRR